MRESVRKGKKRISCDPFFIPYSTTSPLGFFPFPPFHQSSTFKMGDSRDKSNSRKRAVLKKKGIYKKKVQKKPFTPPKVLPITLLSGFLVSSPRGCLSVGGRMLTIPSLFRGRERPLFSNTFSRPNTDCVLQSSSMTLARKLTTVHHQSSSAANTLSSSINVDASLIKKTHTINQTKEKVISLQNGCICCTLRGDLLQELVRISKLQTFDYMIIESSGISEPEQVSETFDDRFAQQMMDMGSIEGAPGLDEESIRILKEVYAP
jgi:hypothetical protein